MLFRSPVFVSDSGDNTTAGAAGDSTELLGYLLEQPAPCLAAGITDRPFVEAFWDCPAGTALTASLGGTLDPASPRVCSSDLPGGRWWCGRGKPTCW